MLKPGSKRYAAALNALERAETVGAEVEIAQNKPKGGYVDTGVDLLADD